jgi:hypothetical protein
MKKTIALLTLLISILTTTYSYSQDKILYKTGEEIEVKITEVGVDYVKYKKINFLNGPNFKINQSTLLSSIIRVQFPLLSSKLIKSTDCLRQSVFFYLLFPYFTF